MAYTHWILWSNLSWLGGELHSSKDVYLFCVLCFFCLLGQWLAHSMPSINISWLNRSLFLDSALAFDILDFSLFKMLSLLSSKPILVFCLTWGLFPFNPLCWCLFISQPCCSECLWGLSPWSPWDLIHCSSLKSYPCADVSKFCVILSFLNSRPLHLGV